MQDKMAFQPEAFPLEVLGSEEAEAIAFEDGELEDERYRGGRGGSRQGFSGGRRAPGQGFSARRRTPGQGSARRRAPGRPLPTPWPPRPGSLYPYPPRRRRWPAVPWPIGGLTFAEPQCPEPPACVCPPAAGGAAPEPDTAAPPDPAAMGAVDAGATGAAAAGDEEFFGGIASRIGSGLGTVLNRARSALTPANVIDLTAQADKSHRKGARDPKTVYALVLHQMACCFKPKDPLKRFLSINSHFAITADGRILQLHPVSALLWASNGFNAKSVAVEFAGNFPSTRGQWWMGETYGKNRPTPAQVTAGRQLIQHLTRTIGLTHVLAHRQSSGTRENDPGPDLWYDVGQWAVSALGLKDGGAGFKIGTGNPIPDEWRTWGSRRPAVTPEVTFESEMESLESEDETEIAHDKWEQEDHEYSGKESIMANRPCNCPRCAGAVFQTAFETETGYQAETAISEEEEMDLALELLAVSSEAELDQFLGKLVKGAWRGLKKVGSVVGKIAKPLGGVLRAVAKKALPMVGGALGSFIPIPGVGTAIGTALGSAVGKALEAETGGMNAEDRNLEVARRFVRMATLAARQAAAAPAGVDSETAVNQAVISAAKRILPSFQFDRSAAGFARGSQQGRWIRRGRQVVLLGA